LRKTAAIMRALLQLSILIHLIVKTSQDVRDLDFEDSLDMFQECSIHLIQNELEVSLLSLNVKVDIIAV